MINDDTTIMRQQGGSNATGRTPMDEWQASVRERAAEMAADILRTVDMQPSPTGVRVDAWLEAHREWIAASADRQQLRMQWRACAQWFGADSDPARGVLLTLVRLAWGPDGFRGVVITEPVRQWRALIRGGSFDAGGMVEALLAALESAPCP